MSNKRAAEPSKGKYEDSRGAPPATSRLEISSSSNASSQPEQAQNQIDFQFLNFSHPSDAKASRARRTVRSHVTRQQHQREHALQAARRAQSFQGPESDTEPPSLRRPHARTFPEQRPATLELPGTTGTILAAPSTSSPETSPNSPSPAASPTDSPAPGVVDLAGIYPERWHPYIPRIMEDYRTNMAVDIPELDRTVISGLLRTRFFPFTMTDAASVHAVMLMAASHYSRARGPRSHTIDLLQLKGMAIAAINSGLSDPRRATSDQVIIAVAMMASFEALYGDRAFFETHMTGLVRMVTLRGGLHALGLDGLLERILLWIDSNATHILGKSVYFNKAAFPTRAGHPTPEPRRFAGLSVQSTQQ
ncbi:Fungal specific transcription factor domain [Teratosphaeria destructans]|uniref:Fungal specific transcription factor domain n=1 Tax=Teratosphaeria destructans TaxID=418781 RepID=A0A9W7SZH3_9PEZI|nr:Fungal specific transcription factor domain [Teratosphaeria destructans]